MGSDGHIHLELIRPGQRDIDYIAEFKVERDYDLFGLLSGMSQSQLEAVVPVRGFPTNSSSRLSSTFYEWVDTADLHRPPDDLRTWKDKQKRIAVRWGYHSPNYLTDKELAVVYALYIQKRAEHTFSDINMVMLEAVLAMMATLRHHGEPRLVFFCDC